MISVQFEDTLVADQGIGTAATEEKGLAGPPVTGNNQVKENENQKTRL